MKTLTISPWQRKLLAIGILLLVLSMIIMAIAKPIQDMHAKYDAQLESRKDQIARYQRVIATRAEYERAIAALKKRDATRFYLKSLTPALAAADIQQVLQTLVEVNNLRLESTGITPHKDEDGRRKVTVTVRLRGKLESLQHFLYAIESTQPYLFVDNVNIQATVRQNYVPQPNIEPDITAGLEIYGYALKRRPDAKSGH